MITPETICRRCWESANETKPHKATLYWNGKQWKEACTNKDIIWTCPTKYAPELAPPPEFEGYHYNYPHPKCPWKTELIMLKDDHDCPDRTI